MTITEARSEAPAAGSAAGTAAGDKLQPAESGDFLLDSSDHKRVGLVFLVFSLLFLLGGAVVGSTMHAELASPGVQVVGGQYIRLFSAHAQIEAVLFLAPFWLGLATYLVPLQIGASRLAFPRVQALAAWLFVIGGLLHVVSYLLGPPPGLGLAGASPLQAPPGGVGHATDLWVTSLMMVALAMLLASGNIVVTCLSLRADGMTLMRMPMFSWSMFATAAVGVLSTGAYLAGLLLLYMDLHFGQASLFGAPGARLAWDHLLWLYGRPDILLLTLPALGVASEVVVTAARRPLLDHRAGVVCIVGYAALTVTSYAVGTHATASLLLPTPTWATALVVVPVGALTLLWLGTLAQGHPRSHPALPFVAAAVVCWLVGAANAVIAAFAHVHGAAFGTGHLHVVAFGPPTLLAFGALVHWGPKLFGRPLTTAAAGLVAVLSLVGILVSGLGGYIAGYQGQANHYKNAVTSGTESADRFAFVGGILLGLGAVLLLLDVVRAAAAGRGPVADGPADPYGGLTLEWATTSPPPPHNFDEIPEVRSEAPLADFRDAVAPDDPVASTLTHAGLPAGDA